MGSGDNTILGGMGADQITSVNGTDTILGDNGFVQMDVEGNNFAQIATKSQASTTAPESVTELGGNDVITALAGTKRVLGGDGSDTITVGTGDHTIFGDNGVVTFVAIGQIGAGNALVYATTDTLPVTGGDDTITAGNGNNTIFGGMGNDTITTGDGTDTILGDNGFLRMDVTGTLFLSIESTVTLQGGDDVIRAGDGNKTVIGGYGADKITIGTGTHTLLGDNGNIEYSPIGIRSLITTTELLVGGNDQISAAGGDTIVLAGLGDDMVTTGAGADVQVGDDGFVILDALGRLYRVETTVPNSGGNDSLSGGGGNDVLIGGYGSDKLFGGDGNDFLLGDGGRVTYVGGLPNIVETIDPFIGKADFLDGGAGQNVLIGGNGDDLIVGNLNNDVMAGDYASVTFDGSGHVTSVIRFGSGNDLLAQIQESLFTFVRPKDGATVTVGVYREPPSPAGDGDSAIDQTRLRDYLILPTLAGFEFSSEQHHSDSGSATGSQGAGGQSDTQGQSTDSLPGAPQEGGSDETGPDAQPGGQDASPTGTAPSSQPPNEGAEIGNTPAAEPKRADDLTAGLNAGSSLAASGDTRSSGEEKGPLELAAAGLLGVHTLQPGRRIFSAPKAVKATADLKNGRWIPARADVPGAQEVLLDRRARPRVAAAPRLEAGAIEQAAQNWLDGALGMHSRVETKGYETGRDSRQSIDWSKMPKDRAGRETK